MNSRTVRPVSITWRLALAITLILGAGGLLVTAAAYAYGRQAAGEAYDRLLAGAAFEIARSVSITSGRVVVDLPTSAFELLGLAPTDRVIYRVLDRDGATVTGYDAVPQPPQSSDEVVFYAAEFGGETVRLAATRRRFAERAYSGEVGIVVGHTTRARTALAWDITAKALLILAAAGLATVALTAFAVRSSLRPLRRIERAIAARNPQDLSPLTVSSPREIETIVVAINRFMDRLGRRVTVMQTLIADATHQLRTPIAALRAQAELATAEENPERLRVIVGRIHQRTVGLSRLADQLLNQALIIHRADAVEQQRLDLRAIAVRVAEEIDHDLPEMGRDLVLDLPDDPVEVQGDAFSLVEAAKNLVNNAFRHGERPVRLAVASLAGDGRAEIAISDKGAGVPAAHWADSGRRFAKTAGSSARDAGLGLAIVNAVAEAHAGRLEFSRAADGGFRAALRLPLRREAKA
jgi:two-component system, OmpR family, sensor histidine kinase TctE